MASLDSLISTWNTEFDKISKPLMRYKVFQAIDPSFAGKFGAQVGGVEATITEFMEVERTRYMTEDINSIDPITMFDIIEGVMWPTISSQDSALVDHPNGDELLISMRGVTIKQLFEGKVFRETDVIHTLSPKDLPFTKNAYEALQAVSDKINDSPLEAADQKKTLSSIFNSEDAAALWYLGYGNLNALGNPIQTMATLNPYLGYFLMIIAWLGGTTQIVDRKIGAAIAKDGGFPLSDLPKTQSDAIANSAVVGNFKSLNATIAAIGANHEWLQKQKTNEATKDYYKGWADRFVNNPDCIVNMAIIINEKVNINSKFTYKYSAKAKKRLTELGAAYMAGFNITAGE
jgi:hypothetical protein